MRPQECPKSGTQEKLAGQEKEAPEAQRKSARGSFFSCVFGFLCVGFLKENYQNDTTHRQKNRLRIRFRLASGVSFSCPANLSCVSLFGRFGSHTRAPWGPLAATPLLIRKVTSTGEGCQLPFQEGKKHTGTGKNNGANGCQHPKQ